MTLNNMVRKLAKHNAKRYLVFCISVVFAVSVLGAFGVLLFSSTISNVLVSGGSTFSFALGMFGFTVIGLMVFLVYADSIYIGHKMNETGILLSLGLKHQTVLGMLRREFRLLFGVSALSGLILSIPAAAVCWSLLTAFLTTAETDFSVGWGGLLADILFVAVMWGFLAGLNVKKLKSMDIIKIMKLSSEREETTSGHPLLGLMGLAGIPCSLLLFYLCDAIGGIIGKLSPLFLVLSLFCLYLLTNEITSIGLLFRKYFHKAYLKNILFFNLVRQKGRQYTFSLFVSAILIAVTIFGICFISTIYLEGYYQITEDPYDYSLLVGSEQQGLDESSIRRLTDEYQIAIQEFAALDMLLIGRKHQYDSKTTEWSGQYITNASSYELLTHKDVTVPQGTCLFFTDMVGAPEFRTIYQEEAFFYNPTAKQEFRLTVAEKIAGDKLINRSGPVVDFFILHDKDYEQLKSNVEPRYHLKYYLFTASPSPQDTVFYQALLERVIQSSDGMIFDNFFDSPVRELMLAEGKDIKAEDSLIPYKGNEQYGARWWDRYPFSKENALATQTETGAIYFLIMFFIALLAFISAIMVIGLKILGTVWQDEANYQKASCLGLKKRDLKKLISRQISLIYYYPTVLGCITGVFMIHQIVLVSSSSHVGPVTMIAAALALGVAVIQTFIYMILKGSVIKKAAG